ncbi:MAG: adenosylcobalamin-dependent ribonucleoside-diphosphate reductase, partial [Ignavibacteriae bacterium]|nr:adenosylcobalamin-dependent ribonucleoside-diphosphate reductase [Ignavibacteriota bacterium]
MKVQKRNNEILEFDKTKIEKAVLKAGQATTSYGEMESKRIAEIVENIVKKTIETELIDVEKLQDIVEQCIMAAGHYDAAKAYILYRKKRDQLRDAKAQLGVEDPLKLSLNQVKVLRARHIRKDANGKPVESTAGLFERVANAIANVDKKYGVPEHKIEESKKQYYEMMTSMKFIPGGSYLRNAGYGGPLNNCHVLPIDDSIEQIYETIKNAAILTKYAGGGVGYNFSRIRPAGSYIASSGGLSTGPLSFMEIIDASTTIMSKGGYKKGANMGVLNVDHPDIIDFIKYKKETHGLTTFNVSVALTDRFINAVRNQEKHQLIDPKTKQVVSEIDAVELFDFICRNAHDNGDPGALFLDNANKDNQVPGLGRLESTNICGEIWLFPYDVCNLGSLNLGKFIKPNNEFDYDELARITRVATRFMDCGVDLSEYPVREVTEMAQANRRIGLGIMGLADALIQLELPYDSEEARIFARNVMKTINEASFETSKQLAIEKGNFAHYDLSIYKDQNIPMRNCARTAVAPTGSISMVADASSGCEP